MQMLGVSWDDSKKPTFAVTLASLLSAALIAGTTAGGHADAATNSPSARLVDVIVRKASGSGRAAERAVRAADGTVGRRLGIIDGFAARLPRSAVDDLRSATGVRAVTANGRVEMSDHDDDFDGDVPRGSLYRIALRTGAVESWYRGITGEGVDVALIDTGVTPVPGLDDPGKVVNGPDLSFESQDPALRHYDTYGHGTHMAGIIAGRDAGIPDDRLVQSYDKFTGIAPGARLVSVKVGDAEGATDVSQVIAAIDWVVKHRRDNGLNIRVLNLSFGTDGAQQYVLDPLSYAAEVAWRKGIVVVVAGGNRGYGTRALNNPALNPQLIAVGSVDPNSSWSLEDDEVSPFSSHGNSARRVDVVAPGRSVRSLRVPGSLADVEYPSARTDSRYFKGSGTSQAAAVVSGAAALLLDDRPSLSPDQVKALLMSSARSLPNASVMGQGAGVIDVNRARRASTPLELTAAQSYPSATGLGTLDGARGSNRLVSNGIELSGQQDIFGNEWTAESVATSILNETNWVGGVFNGHTWTGVGWDKNSWSAVEWTKNSWSGELWTKNSWSKNSWSGSSWTGDGWVKNSWSAGDWSKNSWSDCEWYKNSWSSAGWE